MIATFDILLHSIDNELKKIHQMLSLRQNLLYRYIQLISTTFSVKFKNTVNNFCDFNNFKVK